MDTRPTACAHCGRLNSANRPVCKSCGASLSHAQRVEFSTATPLTDELGQQAKAFASDMASKLPASPVRIEGARVAVIVALAALAIAVWSTLRPSAAPPAQVIQQQVEQPRSIVPAYAAPVQPERPSLADQIQRSRTEARQRELDDRVRQLEEQRAREELKRSLEPTWRVSKCAPITGVGC